MVLARKGTLVTVFPYKGFIGATYPVRMPEKFIHGFSPQGLASLYEAVRRQFVSPFGAVQFERSHTSKNVCKSATQSFIFCIGTSYSDLVLTLISIPFPPLDVFLSSMLLKLDKYL